MTAPTLARPAYADLADWDLVAATQAGDRDAYGELYRRYRGFIINFLCQKGMGWQAEDLCSEVFVRALASIDRVQKVGTSFRPWLTTIARNITIDYVRSARASEVRVPYLPESLDVADGPDTDEVAIGCLDTAVIVGLLSKLVPAQREVLVLRFLGDLPVSETQQRMGLSSDAVKALTLRALRTARKHATRSTR